MLLAEGSAPRLVQKSASLTLQQTSFLILYTLRLCRPWVRGCTRIFRVVMSMNGLGRGYTTISAIGNSGFGATQHTNVSFA